MSRPPTTRNDTVVDAAARARAASEVERTFAVDDMPRLMEAGAREGSTITATLRFSEFDGRPVVEGGLHGTAILMCQRCMRTVGIRLQEPFHVMLVPDERADEPGGYEPVVADVTHFDLRWFVEEQALLALPLVPMHEPTECAAGEAVKSADAREGVTQRPFENLRNILRE